MARTLDERFEAIENDINRMNEQMQEVATVDDAHAWTQVRDETMQGILERIRSLTEVFQALRYKWQVAAKKDK